MVKWEMLEYGLVFSATSGENQLKKLFQRLSVTSPLGSLACQKEVNSEDL
jgi:hypothetical protein